MPLPLGRTYGVFQGNVAFGLGDFILESALDNITASPGGGQSGAFPINAQTSRVVTVATIGDSIMLPSATAGLELIVINHGLNAMQVFGNSTDRIDDQAPGIGVAQMSNSMVIFTCVTAGNWYTEGLSSGFATSLGLQTFSYQTSNANIGNTQATGTPITTMMTNFNAAAIASGTLPVAVPGLELTVHNISASIVTIFPNAGGTTTEKINVLAANAGLAMAAGTSTVFTSNVAGQWWTVPRVPS